MKKRGERKHSTTADFELTTNIESGQTQHYRSEGGEPLPGQEDQDGLEADIILIAHPEHRRLGRRFRLRPGTTLEIGRSSTVAISLPEVPSISRRHARLRHLGPSVVIEDLGSTNGTYRNGELVRETAALESGDRFQVAAVHFKFLHGQDVEHAYYEAIYNLVIRDGLTDIFNKRKYDEEVEREFSRSRRHNRPLSLILLDIDSFKSINDEHGHLCGDFVLKQVTTLVKESIRPEQVFARVGGDEFVVLAPETTADGALTLAEKLRDQVAGHTYVYSGTPVAVTCSFGVAELTPVMDRAEDLYAAADRALLSAKGAGRNRVTVAEPS